MSAIPIHHSRRTNLKRIIGRGEVLIKTDRAAKTVSNLKKILRIDITGLFVGIVQTQA